MRFIALTLFCLSAASCVTYVSEKSELVEAAWRRPDGEAADGAVLEEPVILSIRTRDIENNASVVFRIYRENSDPNTEKPAAEIFSRVLDGAAETEWDFAAILPEQVIDEGLYAYYKDRGKEVSREELETFLPDYDEPVIGSMKKIPLYFFTAQVENLPAIRSANIKVVQHIEIIFSDKFDEPWEGALVEIKAPDGSERSGVTNVEGRVEFRDCIPAPHHLRISSDNGRNIHIVVRCGR